jgi:hypothetical protein
MTSATAKPPRPLRLNQRERADEQQQHHTAGRRCQTGGEIFADPQYPAFGAVSVEPAIARHPSRNPTFRPIKLK